MGVIDYYKKTAEESKKLFSQNRDIIDAYNFHFLKIFLFFSVAACFILSMLSLIPAISMLYHLKFQIFFSASLCVFFIYAVISMFAAEFVSRHSVVAVYIYIIFADTFSVMVNLLTSHRSPYTVTLGFLVAVPMLMMDSRIRVMIVHVIIAAICLYLSYYFKSDDYFLTDCINCFVFTSVGIFAGDRFRMNNIRYLDLKEHELDRNVEVLRAKNEAKTSFLANMSHEIRTPINAVLGMDEMILRETEDSDIHRYAMNIKQAGNSLLNIVNDVLDFSKIESGKMDLLPETYDISTILVDLVAMASERAQKKDLLLELHINPSLPKMLVGDSVRIKQCILNLLTNAIKYTMQGKVVFRVDYTLESHADGKIGIWLLVSVEDTGIGIKKEDVIKLFQPFERIEEKRNRTIEGTGLGLNIVQRTLALMNSKLDVESEYGKGSTFSFVIWQDVTDVEPVGDIMESYRRRVQFMEKYTEKLVAPRARILLVDDTPINLEVIKGLLKYTKIQLDTVTSGRAALEKVRQHTYDILFIDHRMPEMDGIETLEAMQVLTDNKCLGKPCIALTANAVSGAREMYISAGFSDYLSKPVSPEKLEETIIRYLPPEYIEKPDDSLAFSSMDYDSPEEESKEDLPQIEGIDSEAGLQNCGETGLFIEMLGLVYQGIQENSDAIQSAFDKEDLDMYRIKVHSLKSTARLIGAMELSKKAADLEKAAADNDIDMIREKTADLLELYRSFSKKLAPYAPQEQDSSQNA